jgi:hypothetical protein
MATGTTRDLRSVFLIDENIAVSVGLGGTILKTTNGGTAWNLIASGTTRDLYTVHFINESVGFAAGTGTILKTVDGGDTWVSQPSGVSIDLYRIHFFDVDHGIAVGQQGTILFTNNGGVPTGIEESNTSIPDDIFLYQNYPNPFNPVTAISWQLAVGSKAIIKVYDIFGREVVTLVNEEKPAGEYQVEFNASGLASGIYLYQLIARDYTINRKMILLK